ncbi:hypothetical protein [Nocardiopsis changdeensis]|uniref:hypothetical protein n=1 Tax=Nocardiopsis changdeensis TaxID=2831969 RepID=UPI003F452A3E
MNRQTSNLPPAVRTVRFTHIGLRHGQLGEIHFTDADLGEMKQRIAAHVSERLLQPADPDTLTVVGGPDMAEGHVEQTLFDSPGPTLKVASFVVLDSRKEALAQRTAQHARARYVGLVAFLMVVVTYLGWELGQGPGALIGFLLAVLYVMTLPKRRQ